MGAGLRESEALLESWFLGFGCWDFPWRRLVIDAEVDLAAAVKARREGNPGRARVCSRRAAGAAVRAWYVRLDGGWQGDALKHLKRLAADARAPEAARRAAERLTTRVGHDHRVPFEVDPVEDARLIVGLLAPRSGPHLQPLPGADKRHTGE